MRVTVLREAWRPHPLVWLHQAEARQIAEELRGAGHAVSVVRYGEAIPSRPPAGMLLLRLSDEVMFAAARALAGASIPYLIHETATGRLRFLECDVAPFVGPRSAFTASLAAAGVRREEQLRLLLNET